MPWELVDALGNRYRLPASLRPAQLHVGGSPRVRFVRGYGSEQWFTVQDGIREPEPIDLVGVLQTDRDDVAIHLLLQELTAAAEGAVKLVLVDHDGVPVKQLPLLGALPITTEPDGVDGTFLRVTVPLVPGQADWEAAEESSGPAPIAYEYEVFTASGTWDWDAAGQPATVDVLVVAGGGGGGSRQGGGGGAGGVLIASGVSVTGNVTVTVGAGGAGGTSGGRGQNGQDSSFGAVTATGGGGGGGRSTDNDGASGGSGGGGAGPVSGSIETFGGSGIPGQGHDGGNSSPTAANVGGGGGGRGGSGQAGVGQAESGGVAGSGGPGVTLENLGWGDAITLGAPSAVGGGGGGGVFTGGTAGTGGIGGGGNGQVNDVGSPGAGTPNTGGGGGGSGATTVQGGAGGSGLVIVRWVRP